MNNGFIKIAAAIPQVKVADCQYNASHIENLIAKAQEQDVQIVCFPELSISAYSCADLFHNNLLLDQSKEALLDIVQSTANFNIISIVGLPIRIDHKTYDCAAVIYKGEILSIHPKANLSAQEIRWFTPANAQFNNTVRIKDKDIPFGNDIVLDCMGYKLAVDINNSYTNSDAHIVFTPAAQAEIVNHHQQLVSRVVNDSALHYGAQVYVSAGFGESTSDLVFAGNAFIAEAGQLLAKSKRFSMDEQLVITDVDIELINAERAKQINLCGKECARVVQCSVDPVVYSTLDRRIKAYPFLPSASQFMSYCEEVLNIQTLSLVKRMCHVSAKKLLLGVSGGLDSTLALLVCANAIDRLQMDRKDIIAITMPGFGTSDRTYNNAVNLIEQLGCTFREISIRKACLQHFEDINQDVNNHDAAYENAQARERTQILMDIANQCGGIVVGTGDLSELALGWATYNGDHMSMYAVNGGVTKTLVRTMVEYVAQQEKNEIVKTLLQDIVDTPVSPELLPTNTDGDIAQKTEDLVGPYALHDFFLYYTLNYGFTPSKIMFLAQHAFGDEYTNDVIVHWYEKFYSRFFSQQFKRNCMPEGPKVCSVSLSPRGDWAMPSDASSRIWLDELK